MRVRKLIIASIILIGFVIAFIGGLRLQDTEVTGRAIENPDIVEEKSPYPPQVFFCPTNHCAEIFKSYIMRAQESVHCAIFDMDHPEIIESLKNAKGDVRLVSDIQTIMDNNNIVLLKVLNLSTKDKVGQLMHNKFCIIDNSYVLTGSYNPTMRGTYYNNNNLLVFYSRYLSDNYEAEFNELWGGTFGGGEYTHYPIIYHNNIRIENYFCPEDSCSSHVKEKLGSAKESIYFMTFSFTDQSIGQLLVDKHEQGINIQGVMETSQAGKYSVYEDLVNSGVAVILDKNKQNMHHKVFIIDRNTVITGSYNPTQNGDKRNDENILIIESPTIAEQYLEEFDRIIKLNHTIVTQATPATDIIISEVYYDCSGKDAEEEFVELYNPTDHMIYLQGYSLSDNKSRHLLTGTIMPKSTLIVDNMSISLNNKGGYLVLRDAFSQKDLVSWESMWDLSAPSGQSLQRSLFTHVNSANQWTIGVPSPGLI